MSTGIYIKEIYLRDMSKDRLEAGLEEALDTIVDCKQQLLAAIVNTDPTIPSVWDGTPTHVIDEGPRRLNDILEMYEEAVHRRNMIWEAQLDDNLIED